MKIIAHRGYSQKFPENTLIAFEKAVESGADGIELDVHLTQDKKIIVHHYYTLGHTDNGEGLVFQKDSRYLKSLDVGSWFSEKFQDMKMPFLEEVLELLKDKTIYEIELKAGNREYVDTVLKIVQGYDLLSNIKFTSYQYPLLSYIKRVVPDSNVGLISQPIPDWMGMEVAHEVIKSNLILGEIDVIHASVSVYDQKFVDELHGMGVRVHFGLCDTKEQLQKAIDLGADELTTNDLELAVEIIKGIT